ncbi:hypothetical protein [Adlercreutzia sp. ZJ138]|uniref:hypothetical protein n=1 Tax=Adlercreutzia sp. ZJ138 TaxID=2709405 RepID=UPI0013E9E10A|nr:hypothetical protein [Adlercreutzia sp. ZJ138]
MSQRPGHCPQCDVYLHYDSDDTNDDMIYYYASCPKCGWNGIEAYRLEFAEFLDSDFNPLED